MPLDLKQILDADGWSLEFENETAFFYNNASWIASMAYVHIIYKPQTTDVLEQVGTRLELPARWMEFLSVQNGANLFSGALFIYGAPGTKALLNRSDPLNIGAFSLTNMNEEKWSADEHSATTIIGGYGFDGTHVVLDKRTGEVSARNCETIHRKWSGSEEWLFEEYARLSFLHDRSGKLLVAQKFTLPIDIEQ